jgi:predicted branched-subunit amino acid permease
VSEHRYADGARAVLPISVAALAFGLSFGVLARASGMDALAATIMSATTFAGSAQFAAASILGASGRPSASRSRPSSWEGRCAGCSSPS